MTQKRLAPIARMIEFVAKQRSQVLIFIGLSLGAAVLIGILSLSSSLIFQPFFGELNPLIAILLIILLGIGLILFLLSRGGFAVYTSKTLNGAFLSASMAAVLAFIMILVDRTVIFPHDLNIAFPQSLVFYPAIGYVVEIIFHLLPFSLLLILFKSLFKNISHEKIVWVCIFIVSLLEPIYQTIGFVGKYPLWTVAYVLLHVFLINLFQLSIFKGYDFISMYTFRLPITLFGIWFGVMCD